MRAVTTAVTSTSFVPNHSSNGATVTPSSKSIIVSSCQIKPICTENSPVLPVVTSSNFAAVAAANAATRVTCKYKLYCCHRVLFFT